MRVGIRQTAVTLPGGRIEREFQHWHILPLDLSLGDIPLCDDEVSGLIEVSLDHAISLAAGDLKNVPARYLSRTPAGTRVSDGTLTTPT
jgi:hypothetical protein